MLNYSMPVVSCSLLALCHTPEALALLFGRALFHAAVLVWICTSREPDDESTHKRLLMQFVAFVCAAVGVGVFSMAYPHRGAAAATGLGGLAIGLACLAIACAVRLLLPPDAHDYLRTAFRKHATGAGARPPPPGCDHSPDAVHAYMRTKFSRALARSRHGVYLARAPREGARRTAQDSAWTELLALALYLHAPVALCYLGLVWPASGYPVVSALPALVFSEVLVPRVFERAWILDCVVDGMPELADAGVDRPSRLAEVVTIIVVGVASPSIVYYLYDSEEGYSLPALVGVIIGTTLSMRVLEWHVSAEELPELTFSLPLGSSLGSHVFNLHHAGKMWDLSTLAWFAIGAVLGTRVRKLRHIRISRAVLAGAVLGVIAAGTLAYVFYDIMATWESPFSGFAIGAALSIEYSRLRTAALSGNPW
ncbi:hypothetical protein FA95DRAFT_1596802 [Auriscalpium vulgare]|uniref:Uncharacterized protein n=1 Tax=Auriscalpium vulgare TaxID=40419 RepID=A0ACB8RNI9_9AGAM|nr:hypothetical protein FA95DRAFT_1596802 [Auriscalpium vulgare]